MRYILQIVLFLFSLFVYASDIVVVSLAAGQEYRKTVDRAIENKARYCQLHDYQFVCGEQCLDATRPIQWTKVLILLAAMDVYPSSRWIFWTDADSMFMNLAYSLEDLIDDDYNLILNKDFTDFNTGEFFIRNCPWSRAFLEKVYAHTECINHNWWEQKAIILELEDPENLSKTKILPQRLLNSYPTELVSLLTSTYQTGDFILHFPSLRGLLDGLFDKYVPLVINDPQLMTLDYYLGVYGVQLTENEFSPKQKQKLMKRLQAHSDLKSIALIGLESGHQCDLCFQLCPQLEKITAFDSSKPLPTQAAAEYFKRKYKDRFSFVEEDFSAQKNQFDLIVMNGKTTQEETLSELINARSLAHKESLIWIDNYHEEAVQKAVSSCIDSGLIAIEMVYQNGEEYSWIEARYRSLP